MQLGFPREKNPIKNKFCAHLLRRGTIHVYYNTYVRVQESTYRTPIFETEKEKKRSIDPQILPARKYKNQYRAVL